MATKRRREERLCEWGTKRNACVKKIRKGSSDFCLCTPGSRLEGSKRTKETIKRSWRTKRRGRRKDDGDEGTTGKRGRGEEDKEDGLYVCCKYVGSAYVLSMLSMLFAPRESFIVPMRVLPFLFTIWVFVSLTRLKTLWSISNYLPVGMHAGRK